MCVCGGGGGEIFVMYVCKFENVCLYLLIYA